MTTRLRRSLGIALAALALAMPARTAHAYVRSTVEDDPSTPLWWSQREIPIRVAADTAPGLTPFEVGDALTRSLATWTLAGGCTDIRLVDGGPATGLSSNLMRGMHDGENRVVFRVDDWPAELGPDTLAITTLVYRRSTGEIVDADIDVNAADLTWSVITPVPLDSIDLENTATHELGHLLGFAHVPEDDATMYEYSEPGDIAKRDLAADDVRAVCEVYPFGVRTPGRGGRRPWLTSGCTVMRGDPSVPVGAMGIALVISARRRRARRAS